MKSNTRWQFCNFMDNVYFYGALRASMWCLYKCFVVHLLVIYGALDLCIFCYGVIVLMVYFLLCWCIFLIVHFLTLLVRVFITNGVFFNCVTKLLKCHCVVSLLIDF